MATANDPTVVRCATYSRISLDERGDAAGVTRQKQDTLALAEARGWTVVAELADNDVSAFNGDHRPGYHQLLAMVEAGEIDKVIVWHLSRLWRARTERAAGIDVLKANRVSICAVRGPEIDLSSAYGRGMAGLMGEFDTMESDIKSERVARAAEERALQGKPNGSVPYGYRRRYTTDESGNVVGSRDEIHEPEAAVVREIVARLLAGDTIGAITADLNARRVPPPGAGHRIKRRSPNNADGSKWGPSSVRKLAIRPTNAGHRTYRGTVVRSGGWEPIIDQADHDAVVALLADPGRISNGRRSARKHLLSFGIGQCGVCGDRLRVATRGGHPLYVCNGPKSCVGRRQAWVDGVAEKVMVKTLQRRDVRTLLARGDRAAAKAQLHLDELRARLADATEAYTEGRLPLDALTAITARLSPQIEQAEAELRTTAKPVPAVVRGLVGKDDVEARWDALTVAEKRQVMQALGLVVTINPAPKGPGFKPEFVAITWDAS